MEWLILLITIVYLPCFHTLEFHPTRFGYSVSSQARYSYDILYLDSLVDHFSFVNDHTFKLKYLFSKTSYKPGGPVFFYTGNEGSIETFAESAGFIWESADEFNAAVVFAEHRYYGTSLPFGNESTKDVQHFGYLTAEQALADYAYLIQHLRMTEEHFDTAPFIAFGGSYGGMLSAWMRNKYPNQVAGAIAASAPVWMFPNMSDCHGFMQVATRAYEKVGGADCRNTIAALWNSIDSISKLPQGMGLLTTTFSLCDPLTNTDPLVEFLSDFLGTVAMVNYPYEANFVHKFPGNPVQTFCHMTETSNDAIDPDEFSVLRRVAAGIRAVYNYSRTEKCINIAEGLDGLDVNSWELQTCMEMTVPMCADNIHDMFPVNEWNPTTFSNECLKKFGVRPRMGQANVEWWGKQLKSASNIAFSNGDLDPWSAYGVLSKDDVPLSTVIRIPNGAHHLDLRAANQKDPDDVIQARKMEKDLIRKWIAEWKSHLSSA